MKASCSLDSKKLCVTVCVVKANLRSFQVKRGVSLGHTTEIISKFRFDKSLSDEHQGTGLLSSATLAAGRIWNLHSCSTIPYQQVIGIASEGVGGLMTWLQASGYSPARVKRVNLINLLILMSSSRSSSQCQNAEALTTEGQ